MRRNEGFALACLALTACLPHAPGPYTAADLERDAQRDPDKALLRYLAQPHADPKVCDTPPIRALHPDDIEELVEALADADVRPEIGAGCLWAALAHWDRPRQRRAVAELGKVYLDVLRERDSAPPLRAALRELLLQSAAARAHADTLREIRSELGDSLADRDLDPAAETLAREWLLALELKHNRFHGKPITPDNIPQLDYAALQLSASWLGDQQLQLLAREELVRKRARSSPFEIVRDDVERAVQNVLTTGHDALDLARHPVTALWLDGRATPGQVSARQDVERGTALLVALLAGGETSHVRLKGALWLKAQDVALPVTLCGAADELDPSPCVPRGELAIEAPASSVDEAGVWHLQDALPLEQLLPLAADSARLTLHMKHRAIDAQRSIPLRVEAPTSLAFDAEFPGADGPALELQVRAGGGYALFSVSAPDSGRRAHALLDLHAPGDFTIVSRGAQGSTGSDGSRGLDGSDGSSGHDASCNFSASDGGRGSNGGRGGDGGRGGGGGNGGEIQVWLSCPDAQCALLRAIVEKVVRSRGGPGGSGGKGGSGGRGGRGGRGGSGTWCDVRDASGQTHRENRSGGSSGMDGSSGSSGSDGSSGFPGAPGRVSIARAE